MRSFSGLLRLTGLVGLFCVVLAPAWGAGGDIAAGKAKAGVCAGCHAMDGNGAADPLWPKLAGQDENYLAKQLKDFKTGARKDPIMSGMAAGLSDADVKNIAAYFAGLKRSRGPAVAPQNRKRGEKIYRGGNAKMGVSACMSCHGPSGHGIPPRFPQLAGQRAAYIEKQLLAFKSATRTNDGDVMTRIAFRMSEQEIKAVSEYVAALDPR